MYQPDPTAKGFFGSLFDLSFKSYVITKVIKVFFVLIIIATAIESLFWIIVSFRQSTALGTVVLLIVAPLLFLITIIVARIYFEVVMAIMTIAENTTRMALWSPPMPPAGGYGGIDSLGTGPYRGPVRAPYPQAETSSSAPWPGPPSGPAPFPLRPPLVRPAFRPQARLLRGRLPRTAHRCRRELRYAPVAVPPAPPGTGSATRVGVPFEAGRWASEKGGGTGRGGLLDTSVSATGLGASFV